MILTEVVQSSWEPRAQNQLFRTCTISITTPANCRAGAKPGNGENLWAQEFLGKGTVSWALRGAADGGLLHGHHNCPHDAPQSKQEQG